MAYRITKAGNGTYAVSVSVSNPQDRTRPLQLRRTVGKDTRWPCSSEKQAERTYCKPWERELEEKAASGYGSLTFGARKQKYIRSAEESGSPVATNILGILNGVLGELDNARLETIGETVAQWEAKQKSRTIHIQKRMWVCQSCKSETHHRVDRRWHRPCEKCGSRQWDSELRMVDTGKKLSEETIKTYKTYIRVVLGKQYAHLLGEDFSIGRRAPREVEITPAWIEEVEAALRTDEWSWFWIHVDFAWKNPVRPRDQFRELTSESLTHLPKVELAYYPHKTKRIIALPIIYPEHLAYLTSRRGLLFPDRDGEGCLYPTDESRLYDSRFEALQKAAGCQEIVPWYQLRHVATARLIAQGKTREQINEITGWSAQSDMVDHYHTRKLVSYFRAKYSSNQERREAV